MRVLCFNIIPKKICSRIHGKVRYLSESKRKKVTSLLTHLVSFLRRRQQNPKIGDVDVRHRTAGLNKIL